MYHSTGVLDSFLGRSWILCLRYDHSWCTPCSCPGQDSEQGCQHRRHQPGAQRVQGSASTGRHDNGEHPISLHLTSPHGCDWLEEDGRSADVLGSLDGLAAFGMGLEVLLLSGSREALEFDGLLTS